MTTGDGGAGDASRTNRSPSARLRDMIGARRGEPKRQPWRVEGAGDRDPEQPRPDRPAGRSGWARFWWLWLVLLVVNWVLSSVLLAPAPRPMVAYHGRGE